MRLFQVQYKYNSKTHTINLTSDSWQKVRDFAQDIISGEITEIREFVHTDERVKKDDGDYFKFLKVELKRGENQYCSIKIPKVKKSYDVDLSYLKSVLKIGGFVPDIVKASFQR